MSVLLLIAACGPRSQMGVGTSESSGESSSTGQDVPAAGWMSGAYSSWLLTPHLYKFGAGFTGDSTRYYFHEDGAFEEVHLHDEIVQRTEVRGWEPVSPTRAKLSRLPDDYASLEWIELDLVTPEDGCPFVMWTVIDSYVDPGRAAMWPGEVCVIQDDKPVDDPGPTYNVEWCGDPPSGCAIDGCPCAQ